MGAGEGREYRIAVIPGDGIGVEVIPEGLRALDRLAATSGGRFGFVYESFPWGSHYYMETGRMMDPDGLERLKAFDAIYFGAVGWPAVPDHISLWGLRLAICQGFDQYACVRPVRLLPGVPSPLRDATPERIDWVVVRENSEGEYAGIGGRNLGSRGPDREVALQTALFTAQGCERIIRYAFELARTRKRRKVTSVTKSNAQQYAMTLWDETFERVRKEYPDVETVVTTVFSEEQGRTRITATVSYPSTEVRDILKAQGMTAIVVTHDQHEAFAMADEIGVMRDGRIQQWDSAYNLYHTPANRFVADFVGEGVFLPGTVLNSHQVETEIGILDGPAPAGCTRGSRVEVLLRPDDISHDDASPLLGQVCKKAFRGADILYTLRLENGGSVLSLVPSHHNHAIGERIGIRLTIDHVISFPRD